MKMQYRFLTLVVGLFLSFSVVAKPIMTDDFSTGDLSKSVNGFKWSGSDSPNDLSKSTYVDEIVTRHVELSNGLHFLYEAGSRWAEKRFDLGKPHPELWVRYWIKVPDNFEQSSDSPNNNKFFALWMDDYSAKGDGPTVFWNYWKDDAGSSLTVSYAEGQKQVSGPNLQKTAFISTPDDRGRWMEVVLRVKAASSRSAKDGIIETHRRWEDETSFTKIHEVRDADIAVPPNGPKGWQRGYVMGYANAPYAEDTVWILDEIEFSTSSLLNSPERPLPPRPRS